MLRRYDPTERLRAPHSMVLRNLIIACLALAGTGCAGTREVAAPVDSGSETVTFLSSATKEEVMDDATAALVSSDFTITLANERLGLLQTDYASVAAVERAYGDSTSSHPALRDLYVRLTVNTESRGEDQVVQFKGSFQRIGPGSAPDRLIGLYWMERLAEDVARRGGGEYAPRVSGEIYARALENTVVPDARRNTSRVGQSMRAVGIVAAVLFAATLLAGVFTPGV